MPEANVIGGPLCGGYLPLPCPAKYLVRTIACGAKYVWIEAERRWRYVQPASPGVLDRLFQQMEGGRDDV